MFVSVRLYILIGFLLGFVGPVLSQNLNSDNAEKIHAEITGRVKLASAEEYENLIRFYFSASTEKAIEVCNQWQQKAIQLNDKNAQVDALNSLSRIKIMLGDYPEAESSCMKAIAICKKNKNQNGLANQLGNLGVIAEMTGNYPKAVQYYLSADSVYTITGNIKSRAYIENNLGIVYSNIKVFEKSLYYYLQALEHKKALNDSTGVASTYINIGVLYESVKHDYDKALTQYQKARAILAKTSHSSSKATVYNNIGLILLHQNKLNEANNYFTVALQMQKDLNSRYGIASTTLNLALLAQKQKKYTRQVALAEESAGIYLQNNVKPKLAESYKLLAEGYESLGQKGKALDYFRMYVGVQDSVINETNLKTTQELEARYQNEVNQKKITILEQQNKINRLILVALLLGIAALLITGFYLFRHHRLKQNLRQLAVEHKLLRIQMNPHFIFNSIGSIQNYMYKNDARSASSYLASFAVLMRSILEQSMHDLIPLSEEVNTLRNYLLLEQMRKGNTIQFEITAPPDKDSDEIMVPPMLVQPFVENAVKHAFPEGNSANNTIRVVFCKTDNLLNVQIVDNGIGIIHTQQIRSDHQSMASVIFMQRLSVFGKKWEKQAGFIMTDLSSEGSHGTRVSFNIPLH